MLDRTHLDGADVFVFDAHGRSVPAVDEVRIEPGLAVVAVQLEAACSWWLALNPEETLACVIRSARDGSVHWRGPVRLSYVCE